MNYYNPYFSFYPMASTPARTGILSGLFGGRNFSLGSIISGTQKTLNLVNQAIPVIKQVSPVMKNAKTMFKVMSEFKKTDTPKSTVKNTKINKQTNVITDEINHDDTENNGPTFFI